MKLLSTGENRLNEHVIGSFLGKLFPFSFTVSPVPLPPDPKMIGPIFCNDLKGNYTRSLPTGLLGDLVDPSYY